MICVCLSMIRLHGRRCILFCFLRLQGLGFRLFCWYHWLWLSLFGCYCFVLFWLFLFFCCVGVFLWRVCWILFVRIFLVFRWFWVYWCVHGFFQYQLLHSNHCHNRYKLLHVPVHHLSMDAHKYCWWYICFCFHHRIVVHRFFYSWDSSFWILSCIVGCRCICWHLHWMVVRY